MGFLELRRQCGVSHEIFADDARGWQCPFVFAFTNRVAFKEVSGHHSSKASIFQHSAFFIVQLSHPYMTTGKTIALTRRTFVGAGSTHSSTTGLRPPEQLERPAGFPSSSPRGNPACRGTFGGRRKAVRDRFALQGGTGDFP